MAKKYKVYITQKAQEDIEQIFFYIAEDKINNAHKFILELEKKIYTLETLPERFSLISENEFWGTNFRHLIYKKYRAIYRIEGFSVYVLRVIRGSKLLEI